MTAHGMKSTFPCLLSASLLLSACAGLPLPSPTQPTPQGPQSALESGDYSAAAAQFLDRAAVEQGLARVEWLEQAAWAAARAGKPELLRQALRLYPELALNREQLATYNSYAALASAFDERPAEALRLIGSGQQPQRARPLSDFYFAQALAYRALDDGEAATLMLVQREAYLPEALRADNRARIWNLQLEGARFLFSESDPRYDATTRGWLALGRIARRFWSDELELNLALQDWSRQFPGHVAHQDYWPQASELAHRTLRSAVRRVALLLPLSGRLSGAAGAVRDGFLAAHFAGESPQLQIRIYDSSSNPVSSYEQAAADGAELIVGPLDKQQVEAVVARNGGLLPMLALNYRDQPSAAPQVLEYGLSPEDDARSVAARALADGHTHAIALVSDDDWGQRSLRAFHQAFTGAGGTLLDSRIYSGGPRQYPTTIKDLLRLNESDARAAAMQRLLGEELDTMPVRRQDAQFLFLAASPDEGRQIRPQIRFYHAADLPIYAAGRIYAGRPDPRLDKDLNGVNFCTLPWLLDASESWKPLREAISRAWPNQAERLERLYAMGNDAYLLASALRNANWSQLPPIAGATGELSLDGQRIVRQLPCARFEQGRPQALSQQADSAQPS